MSLICQPMPEISGVLKNKWTAGHPVQPNLHLALAKEEIIKILTSQSQIECLILVPAPYDDDDDPEDEDDILDDEDDISDDEDDPDDPDVPDDCGGSAPDPD